MRLELTGRHVDVTPALRRVIERKLQRLDRIMNGGIVSVHAVLAKERGMMRTDLTVHARGDKFLHGAGAGRTWPLSLGQAVEKTTQQAAQIKGKWQKKKRRRPIEAASESGVAAPIVEKRKGPPRSERPHLVEVSRQPLRPMSVSDAAREISTNGDGVVVFRDRETAAVRVLYRRASGELTLVDTEM